MVIKIKKCRSCNSKDLKKIFDFSSLPLAGSFPKKKLSGELFPLTLIKCESCNLIQTGESIPKSNIFKEYSYETKTSANLVEHLYSLADYISSIEKNSKILRLDVTMERYYRDLKKIIILFRN